MKITLLKFSSYAFIALLIAATGCKEPSDSQQAQPAHSDSKEVVLFTWPDYIDPEVVSQFTAETGIKVKIETYESLTQMKGYLSSKPGHFDLVVADSFYVAELSQVKLITKIKKEAIPNFSNFNPAFLSQEFDRGNNYSVPYHWGSVIVAYRVDKLEATTKSWSMLWDEKLRGRVAMLEDKQDAFSVGLIAEGFSLLSDDPAELQQVADSLLQHAKTMDPRYLDLEDVKSQLMSGELWAAICYSGDAMLLADENENIDCFIPEEGAPLWLDSFAVVRDAPNSENAHRFIDFMSRGEVAAQNANFLWTATPNKAADQFIDPEMKADERVFLTEEIFEKCDFYALPSQERDRISNEGMKAVMDVIHPHVTLQQGSGD